MISICFIDDESKSKRRRIKEDLFDSSSEEEGMSCHVMWF